MFGACAQTILLPCIIHGNNIVRSVAHTLQNTCDTRQRPDVLTRANICVDGSTDEHIHTNTALRFCCKGRRKRYDGRARSCEATSGKADKSKQKVVCACKRAIGREEEKNSTRECQVDDDRWIFLRMFFFLHSNMPISRTYSTP